MPCWENNKYSLPSVCVLEDKDRLLKQRDAAFDGRFGEDDGDRGLLPIGDRKFEIIL